MQVGGLTLLLCGAMTVQFVFFPACRVNGKGMYMTVAYFFLLAVMNFILYALGKVRLSAAYLFGLTMLLGVLFAFLSSAAGWLFVIQLLIFALGEWVFDAVYYRQLNRRRDK